MIEFGIVLAQVIGRYLHERTIEREQIVWQACLYPGQATNEVRTKLRNASIWEKSSVQQE